MANITPTYQLLIAVYTVYQLLIAVYSMSQSKIPVPEAAISILRLHAGSILYTVPEKDVLLNARLLLAQHIKVLSCISQALNGFFSY